MVIEGDVPRQQKKLQDCKSLRKWKVYFMLDGFYVSGKLLGWKRVFVSEIASLISSIFKTSTGSIRVVRS